MRKIFLLLCIIFSALAVSAQNSRHFLFHYAFTISNLPPGQKIDLWFPLAESTEFQQVKVVSTAADLPLQKTRDAKFGNAMLHGTVSKANKSEYKFDILYDVVRHERIALAAKGTQLRLLNASQKNEFLASDRLVPTTGRLADIAATEVQGKTGTLDRARALYDYTLRTMRYDKSGTGWGRGDSEWACDAKRGNCTDFHSVFISMARSQQIPARFEIGFPIPAGKSSGEIPGYHCWADFYDQHYGWVPVDISEAWKDPAKKDYFFGSLDANRVEFTLGRDLTLAPRQASAPRNYFIYPYVEVNGQSWENIVNQFSFQDVASR